MHKRNFSTVHCGATLTCGYLLFGKPDELFIYRTDGYSDFDLSLKKNRTQPSHKICSDIIAFASSLRRQDRAKASLLSNCIFIQFAPVSVHILFSDSLKYSTALCQSQSKKPPQKVFLYFYTIFVCNLPQYML